MTDQLETAITAIQRASDATADATLREQLDSVEEGIRRVTGPDERRNEETTEDHLEEVETQLTEILDDAGGRTGAHVERARDAIDAYRRDLRDDW